MLNCAFIAHRRTGALIQLAATILACQNWPKAGMPQLILFIHCDVLFRPLVASLQRLNRYLIPTSTVHNPKIYGQHNLNTIV